MCIYIKDCDLIMGEVSIDGFYTTTVIGIAYYIFCNLYRFYKFDYIGT